MHDQLVLLARQRVVKASADLEVQLANRSGTAPLLLVLDRFRDKAAESLALLACVNPEDPFAIRTLQNDVMKYDELFAEMKAIINEGKAIDAETSATERDELLDVLTETEEGRQQAIELGLIDDPTASRG